MPRTKPMPIRISTRAILISVLLFNFIAIGLSEVQRRALIYRTQNLISGLERTLSVQGKHLASMNASVGALSILIQNGHFASKQEIETRIEQSLVEGKSVVIRFDDSKLEWRDADGAIRCGLEASQSFLGIFVAGEEYRISYDKQNQKWTGAGPAQNSTRDRETAKCTNLVAAYGPKELQAAVAPAGVLVLWGTKLKLDGLDIAIGDRHVGRIVWVE